MTDEFNSMHHALLYQKYPIKVSGMLQNIKKFLSLTVLSILTNTSLQIHVAHSDTKGVIELFTSQGCSSCPPADELATYYAKNPDYLVLTLPITYWDYLGWKDTFAQKEFTKRQYDYAKIRGDRSVYTPQMVINGYNDAVGSNQGQINSLLETQTLPVKMDISEKNSDLNIKIHESTHKGKGRVWLFLYQKKGTVDIARGENRNRTITYTNIVKDMRVLTDWNGDEMNLTLKKNEILKDEFHGAAFLVQTETKNLPSDILAAASWEFQEKDLKN